MKLGLKLKSDVIWDLLLVQISLNCAKCRRFVTACKDRQNVCHLGCTIHKVPSGCEMIICTLCLLSKTPETSNTFIIIG